MNVLVTGAAGFIGFKTVENLLARGYTVIGMDNMNTYYDVALKRHRLDLLKGRDGFTFHEVDIEDLDRMRDAMDTPLDGVINLAARAGVRYSMVNPHVYVTTNVIGTLNLLELCRERDIRRFVIASTSSLYAGQTMPFSETLAVNEPISPYAASKKGAEAIAYSHHYLYDIDVAVVRYFTVYGPAGRPDMSIFRFIRWIDEGTPITLYGDGTQSRDFTYVEDIAEGTVRAFERVSGYEVINLGGNKPYELNYAIELIERYLGKKAVRDMKPFHKADLMATWADIGKAGRLLGWEPQVTLEEGLERTVAWYRDNIDWVRDVTIDLSV